MMHKAILPLALILGGCATSSVTQQDDGTTWVTVKSGASLALANNELINRANELCPNGYEILDERSHLGWTAEVSKRIRCR